MGTNPVSGYGNGGYGQGNYGSPGVEFLTTGYLTQLISSEYQLSPLFLQWLNAPLKILNDINLCLTSFVTAFDVDYAVGAQLDILGTIAGISRTVGFQPTGGISPVLDDATYRIVIKAQIAQNQWDGTQDGLYSAWQLLFPGGQIAIIDHQRMDATIAVSGSFTPIIEQLILNGYLVPRPQAVKYRYTFANQPLFGFDENDTHIAGFDRGNWS